MAQAKSRETEAIQGGKKPAFVIQKTELPPEIDAAAMASGGYPYDKKMKRKRYDEELHALQIELLKFQAGSRTRASGWSSCSKGATGPAKAAPSIASRSTSIRAGRASWRWPSHPKRSKANGISSATSRRCRPGRNDPLRPLLVQPGRGRARHGVLHQDQSIACSLRKRRGSRSCSSRADIGCSSCGCRSGAKCSSSASTSAATTL